VRCRDRHTALLGALLLSGCPVDPPADGEDDSSEPEPVRLVEYDGWERVTDPSVDVFADQRPADAVCDDAGWFADPIAQTLEVQTELCDYVTLRQDTLAPLEPGDVVTVFAFHDLLTAPEPAQGYLGIAIDGVIEWEHEVPIPGDAASIEQSFTIDRSLPAGTELQYHLHNHGPNTWELLAVLATPASE
jgi:hypothetical protein